MFKKIKEKLSKAKSKSIEKVKKIGGKRKKTEDNSNVSSKSAKTDTPDTLKSTRTKNSSASSKKSDKKSRSPGCKVRKSRSPKRATMPTEATTTTTDTSERSQRGEKKKKKRKFSLKRTLSKSKNKITKFIKKKVSRSKSKSPTQKKKKRRADGGDILNRFITQSLTADIVPGSDAQNTIVAPAALLSGLIFIYHSLKEVDQKKMRKRLEFKEKEFEAFYEQLRSLPSNLNKDEKRVKDVISTFKVLIGEHHQPFQKHFLDTIEKGFGGDTIHCVYKSEFDKWIKEGTLDQMETPKADTRLTILHLAAGIRTSFDGKYTVRDSERAPFAISYQQRQMHNFFIVEGDIRHVKFRKYEAWEIKLNPVNNTPVRLLLIRPSCIGNLGVFLEQTRGEDWERIFNTIKEAKAIDSNLLIPEYELFNQSKLYKNWLEEEIVYKMGEDLNGNPTVGPPIEEIYHWSRLCVNSKGVDFRSTDIAQNSSVKSFQKPVKDTLGTHLTYSFRLDSPFIYMIVAGNEDWVPLMVGTYAGNPSLHRSEIQKPLRREPERALMRKRCRKRPFTVYHMLADIFYSLYQMPSLLTLMCESMQPVLRIYDTARSQEDSEDEDD